jgi:hypothetical protein
VRARTLFLVASTLATGLTMPSAGRAQTLDSLRALARRAADGFRQTQGNVGNRIIEGMINAVTPEADEATRQVQRNAVKFMLDPDSRRSQQHLDRMLQALVTGSSAAPTRARSGTATRGAGMWTGRYTVRDPSTGGEVATFDLSVDFSQGIARNSGCGAPPHTGTVRAISNGTLEVDWPDCGLETVTVRVVDGALIGDGALVAYSDRRRTRTHWTLSRSSSAPTAAPSGLTIQRAGVWVGKYTTWDPSTGGEPAWFDLAVDFSQGIARNGGCGTPPHTGTVRAMSNGTLEVDWPDCGLETVTVRVVDGALIGDGALVAYSDRRRTPTHWTLVPR